MIHRIGRIFEIIEEKDGKHKRLTKDTGLRPDVVQTINSNEVKGTKWRMVYHYASPEDERRAMVSFDKLIYVVDEGELP